MAHPVAYGVNRAETGTITVGGSAANRPATRLYDRFSVPVWTDTASGTRNIDLDKGNTTESIDAVCGIGHNLGGITCTVYHDDNAGFASSTVLGSVVPAAGTPFRVTGTGSTERYWRFSMASTTAAPQIGELFFTVGVVFPYGPADTDLHRGRVANVVKHETESGIVIAFKKGETRWQSTFTIADINDGADRTAFETLFDNLDGGAKPFFYLDEDGTVLRWVEWVNPEVIASAKPLTSDVSLLFREALG
jgi:hypothetical protein